MRPTNCVSWNDSRRAFAAILALTVAAILAAPSGGGSVAQDLIDVIVRARPGAVSEAEGVVTSSGGGIVRRLDIIAGFVAAVPSDTVSTLVRAPSVLAVTPDASVTLLGKGGNGGGGSEVTDLGDLGNVAAMIKSNQLVGSGFDGRGVDVALIDSGVAPVDGLTMPGKVLNGPDLSFESQDANVRYLDTFGHGTHMAGIIAGRTEPVKVRGEMVSSFTGIAPGARIVSVKVANHQGAVDVSQILAAIDWVVQQRNKNGLNIRVLNLSFGTDPQQGYVLDPLSYAVEVAWRKGIFVVVSAGNQGNRNGQLNNPAYNPRIFSVGANVTQGSYDVSDDIVPSWSSLGDGIRNPDLVAPGKSIKSLRVPGSYLDVNHPEGIDGAYFRGSGTSQSAAVVSGVAADIISARPTITPDQLKKLLVSRALPLPSADPRGQGAGMINVHELHLTPTPSASASAQNFTMATGLGTLDAARGGAYVEMSGTRLTGERDIFNKTWAPNAWATASLNETSWVGGDWNGARWSGASWSGASWSGASWSGASWSGASWSGASWSGASWSGARWSGASWSGARWSGASWS